ncbi:MAG TPA: M56 family metallopeptidase, partial [Puia sp.]
MLLIRTLLRGYSLARIKKQARLLSSDKGIRIYEVDRPITPFSFGNTIYINPNLHTEKEWKEIILHEYVHIRQHHTLDILLAELVTILNWYNPFAWALRHSIRQNLEFIADQQVLDKGVDKKEYQYHLLSVMGHPGYRLANNFNFSSLKKRIVMMNKIRSARLHLLRFLFLLPLLAVILLAFRGRYPKFGGHNDPVFLNAAGIVIALPEKTPLQGVTVREKRTGLQTTTDANGYYKFHIPVTTDSVHIRLDYTKQGFEPGGRPQLPAPAGRSRLLRRRCRVEKSPYRKPAIQTSKGSASGTPGYCFI